MAGVARNHNTVGTANSRVPWSQVIVCPRFQWNAVNLRVSMFSYGAFTHMATAFKGMSPKDVYCIHRTPPCCKCSVKF